jgi:sulfite reductase alpha subunit-like flavoprotein
MLERVAKEKNLDYAHWFEELKESGRFHVEVY